MQRVEQPHAAPPLADREAGLDEEAPLERAQARTGLAREHGDRLVAAGRARDELREPARARITGRRQVERNILGATELIEQGCGQVMGALQGRRALNPAVKTIGFECTIGVPSIDAVEAAVVAGGGKILLARSVIVGVGTLMFFEDPEGNVFGAMQYDARAE